MLFKFNANKYQDSLLAKRLAQINSDEMKERLKLHRESTNLLSFLNECQKTTGNYNQQQNECKMKTKPPPLINNKNDFNSKSSFLLTSQSNIEIIKDDKREKKQRSCSSNVSNRKPPPPPPTRPPPTGLHGRHSSIPFKLFSLSTPNETHNESSFNNENSLSTLEWYTTTINFDDDDDDDNDDEEEEELKYFTQITKPQRPPKQAKPKITKEFQSESLNFLFNSNSSFDISTTTPSLKTSRQSKLIQRRPQMFPIQINMSRNLLKKKRLQIMSENETINNLKVLNEMKQIQNNLDLKVKRFTATI
jgi:hypothetical protein